MRTSSWKILAAAFLVAVTTSCGSEVATSESLDSTLVPPTSDTAVDSSTAGQLSCLEQSDPDDLAEAGDATNGPTIDTALRELEALHPIFEFQSDLLEVPPMTFELPDGERAEALYIDSQGRKAVFVALKRVGEGWTTESLTACAP